MRSDSALLIRGVCHIRRLSWSADCVAETISASSGSGKSGFSMPNERKRPKARQRSTVALWSARTSGVGLSSRWSSSHLARAEPKPLHCSTTSLASANSRFCKRLIKSGIGRAISMNQGYQSPCPVQSLTESLFCLLERDAGFVLLAGVQELQERMVLPQQFHFGSEVVGNANHKLLAVGTLQQQRLGPRRPQSFIQGKTAFGQINRFHKSNSSPP